MGILLRVLVCKEKMVELQVSEVSHEVQLWFRVQLGREIQEPLHIFRRFFWMRRHGRTSSSGCCRSAPEIDWLLSRPAKGRIHKYEDQEFSSHFRYRWYLTKTTIRILWDEMIRQLDLHIRKMNPNISTTSTTFNRNDVLVDTFDCCSHDYRLFFTLGYARWPPDPSPVSRVKAPVEGQCSVWCSPTTTVGMLRNLKFQIWKANAFGMTRNEDAEEMRSKVNCCSVFQCEEQIVFVVYCRNHQLVSSKLTGAAVPQGVISPMDSKRCGRWAKEMRSSRIRDWG